MDRYDEALQRLLEIVKPAADARVLNVTNADETLSYEDEQFDVVTCGAAHYFVDVYRFALEARRVLKVGGVLAISDDVLPEHKRAREYLNAFSRLREPEYGRAYSESEWRSTFLDADFTVEYVESETRRVELMAWASDCTPYVIERLQILLAQAPQAAHEWLRPACVGTADASFDQASIIITGKKHG
jgi:ubiquinone/menaquinone biosynthesis C-methylase UbiE